MKKTLLIITLSLFLTNFIMAMEPLQRPSAFGILVIRSKNWFSGEGYFVKVPGAIGESSFTTVGCAILCPFDIVISPFFGEIPNPSRYFMASKYTFGIIGKGLVGFPFYLTKSVFWDAPVHLWNVITDQVPFYKKVYPYGNGNLELEVVIMTPSKRQGNIMFTGNKHAPVFTYDSDKCKIKLKGKVLVVNGTKYISPERIYSIRIGKELSVEINGITQTKKYLELNNKDAHNSGPAQKKHTNK